MMNMLKNNKLRRIIKVEVMALLIGCIVIYLIKFSSIDLLYQPLVGLFIPSLVGLLVIMVVPNSCKKIYQSFSLSMSFITLAFGIYIYSQFSTRTPKFQFLLTAP